MAATKGNTIPAHSKPASNSRPKLIIKPPRPISLRSPTPLKLSRAAYTALATAALLEMDRLEQPKCGICCEVFDPSTPITPSSCPNRRGEVLYCEPCKATVQILLEQVTGGEEEELGEAAGPELGGARGDEARE